MRLLSGAVLCLFLLFPPGCVALKGRSGFLDERSLPPAEDLYAEILHKNKQVRSLTGYAKLRLHGERKTPQFGGVIACSREGSLRFEVLDFWDHVVFLALLNKGAFSTYSVGENEYFEGAADAAEVEKVIGIRVRGEDLIELILGNPFFVGMEATRVQVSVDEEAVLLDAEDPVQGTRYLVWLDREKRPLRSILMRSPGGRGPAENLEVTFERYRNVDEHCFPFRIRVSGGGGEEVFSLEYQSVALGEELRQDLFEFTPPSDAERVTW